MKISLNKKHVIYSLGTIVLGALGSGLWDLAIKPSLIFVTEFFVDVVLGAFQGIQNSIFEEVASLNQEITGRVLLSFGMGLILGTVAGLVTRVLRRKDSENKKKETSKFDVALFGLFVFVFCIFTVSKTSYVLTKQDHYLQLKTIVSPYLTSEARLKIDSRFALIQSIEDYKKIMNEMRGVATTHQIPLPDRIK